MSVTGKDIKSVTYVFPAANVKKLTKLHASAEPRICEQRDVPYLNLLLLPHHHPAVSPPRWADLTTFFFVGTLPKKPFLPLIFILGSLQNRFLLVICQGHSFTKFKRSNDVNYRRYSDVFTHHWHTYQTYHFRRTPNYFCLFTVSLHSCNNIVPSNNNDPRLAPSSYHGLFGRVKPVRVWVLTRLFDGGDWVQLHAFNMADICLRRKYNL